MNVLQLVRKQTQRKEALRAAQKASLQANPTCLVYRGVPYEVSK